MNKTKTIVYINFTPYENSGNILDYILEDFQNVIVFSLKFHSLSGDVHTNQIQIFKKGGLVKTYKLFQLPVPRSVLFLLLPIRSLLLLLQIVAYVVLLKIKFKKIDYYFTVNAFTAWIGIILKKLGAVSKTIFWVWDYYPPIHEDKIVMFMRWVYWQFDKASTNSDKVIFLNERLESLRRDIGILPNYKKYSIIPIGTNPINKKAVKESKKVKLIFLGVLKKSQGIEIVFKTGNELIKKFKNVELHIVGSGPDEEYFKKLAKKSNLPTTFYGYINENEKINEILSGSNIGIACYIPDPSNVSYYGDPSKIKLYLSYGLPVITTNVFEFSNKIKEEKAGIILDYNNQNEFIEAISKILKGESLFSKNALTLSRKYYYKKIYKKLFSD